MNILFIHQNMPGQFRHLIARLQAEGRHRIVCIGQRGDFAPSGIGRVTYTAPPTGLAGENPFLAPLDLAVRNGLQVLRACEAIAAQGFAPDVVAAHPGWGESLYVKQVFPRARLLHYCEFFYSAVGADIGFDPAEKQDREADCATLTRNAPLLMSLEAADWGMSPTHWQKSRHPAAYRDKISVLFDGIDTDMARPNPSAAFALPDGTVLRPGGEVVTYVARSLEPYRGFPSFMRALALVLHRRPTARAVILGDDGISYGRPPPGGGTWRETMMAECGIDPARVCFLGHVSRDAYTRLLQVSAAHVYLTVPFVLSWSVLEAMASGCLVIGSATPPLQEVVEDGVDGVLVDFFSSEDIAAHVLDALANPARYAGLRTRARWTALSRYSLDRCVPAQMALLEQLARGERPKGETSPG